jgi:PAS domain S-box-containing protein
MENDRTMKMESLSLEEFREVVEQAPIMIWRSDRTAACDYFNERWLAFRGRTAEQEAGDGWTEGVHPEDLERCLGIYKRAFGRRKVFEMEYRLRRFDDVYRWIFDRGGPFKGPTGEFAGYIGSCIDVTERVEAREALRTAQEAEVKRLQQLLPICLHCKSVRDDQGYWTELEAYLKEHADMKFTPGLCPKCIKELYPKIQVKGRSEPKGEW